MKNSKIFFHVIEEGHYGDVASHGYYTNLKEAEAEADRLQGFFQELNFYVFQSTKKSEPIICTI